MSSREQLPRRTSRKRSPRSSRPIENPRLKLEGVESGTRGNQPVTWPGRGQAFLSGQPVLYAQPVDPPEVSLVVGCHANAPHVSSSRNQDVGITNQLATAM